MNIFSTNKQLRRELKEVKATLAETQRELFHCRTDLYILDSQRRQWITEKVKLSQRLYDEMCKANMTRIDFLNSLSANLAKMIL